MKDYGVNAVSTAAATCAAIDAHLPLPLNKQHSTEMRAAFDAFGAKGVVLDGNDIDDDGQWLRADGTAIGYFNWWPGQPITRKKGSDYLCMSSLSVNHGDNGGTWTTYGPASQFSIICEQDKPECCTADNIVLECSPNEIELNVPRCFLEQQSVSPSTVFVGEDAAISACQGAFDGFVVFFELR